MTGEPTGLPERTTRIYLERSWVKRQLIHELAREEHKQNELATKFQVSEQAISDFKHRHGEEIEAVRTDLENEFAGLWIADKANRLTALQDDAEYVDARLRSTELADALQDYVDADDSDEAKRRAERVADILSQDPQWMRLRHQVLRAAAEELGQIPNRTTLTFDSPVTVRHELVGIDLDEL